MSQLEQIAKNVIMDKKAMDDLFYYFERWQDEKEYENWQDYANAIEKRFAYPNIHVKASKRPFGFIMSSHGMKIRISVKVKRNQYQVDAVIM